MIKIKTRTTPEVKMFQSVLTGKADSFEHTFGEEDTSIRIKFYGSAGPGFTGLETITSTGSFLFGSKD